MKIVVNRCWGGFGVSMEAVLMLYTTSCTHIKKLTPKEWSMSNDISLEKAQKKLEQYSGLAAVKEKGKVVILHDTHRDSHEGRSCPELVNIIEKLGSEKVSSELGELTVIEIPDD